MTKALRRLLAATIAVAFGLAEHPAYAQAYPEGTMEFFVAPNLVGPFGTFAGVRMQATTTSAYASMWILHQPGNDSIRIVLEFAVAPPDVATILHMDGSTLPSPIVHPYPDIGMQLTTLAGPASYTGFYGQAFHAGQLHIAACVLHGFEQEEGYSHEGGTANNAECDGVDCFEALKNCLARYERGFRKRGMNKAADALLYGSFILDKREEFTGGWGPGQVRRRDSWHPVYYIQPSCFNQPDALERICKQIAAEALLSTDPALRELVEDPNALPEEKEFVNDILFTIGLQGLCNETYMATIRTTAAMAWAAGSRELALAAEILKAAREYPGAAGGETLKRLRALVRLLRMAAIENLTKTPQQIAEELARLQQLLAELEALILAKDWATIKARFGLDRDQVDPTYHPIGAGICPTVVVPAACQLGPDPLNCVVPHEAPSCDDPTVCAYVCEADRFCCEHRWDQICVELAKVYLGQACGLGPCTFAKATAGCNDGACCGIVCALAPYCCDVIWDEPCAVLAVQNCAASLQDHFSMCGSARHSCFEASPLPGCASGLCCDLVCAIDPSCCTLSWDEPCAKSAGARCIVPGCNAAAGNPEAACCTARNSPACSDPACCGLVCAVDPYCCDSSWDQRCVGLAELHCGLVCNMPVCGLATGAPCTEASFLPGCRDGSCCTSVCAIDAYCCSTRWDESCVRASLTVCASRPCPTVADLNCDGLVDGADLGILLAAWGSIGGDADLNRDTLVDGADLGVLLAAWSTL